MSETIAVPNIPIMDRSRQWLEKDKSDKYRLFTIAGYTVKESEPLNIIEREIAALNKRLQKNEIEAQERVKSLINRQD